MTAEIPAKPWPRRSQMDSHRACCREYWIGHTEAQQASSLVVNQQFKSTLSIDINDAALDRWARLWYTTSTKVYCE